MPMKNFLNRTKKSDNKEKLRRMLKIRRFNIPTGYLVHYEYINRGITRLSHWLRPMFSSPLAKAEDENKHNSQKFNFTHDTNLNSESVNPEYEPGTLGDDQGLRKHGKFHVFGK